MASHVTLTAVKDTSRESVHRKAREKGKNAVGAKEDPREGTKAKAVPRVGRTKRVSPRAGRRVANMARAAARVQLAAVGHLEDPISPVTARGQSHARTNWENGFLKNGSPHPQS